MEPKSSHRAEYSEPPIELANAVRRGEHYLLGDVGEFVVDEIAVGYPVEERDGVVAPNREAFVTRIEFVAPGECIVMGLAELEDRIDRTDVLPLTVRERDEELHAEWESHGLL